jgi:hypothetical protein
MVALRIASGELDAYGPNGFRPLIAGSTKGAGRADSERGSRQFRSLFQGEVRVRSLRVRAARRVEALLFCHQGVSFDPISVVLTTNPAPRSLPCFA